MTAFHYRIFGLTFDSEIEIQGLSTVSIKNPDVHIRYGSVPENLDNVSGKGRRQGIRHLRGRDALHVQREPRHGPSQGHPKRARGDQPVQASVGRDRQELGPPGG